MSARRLLWPGSLCAAPPPRLSRQAPAPRCLATVGAMHAALIPPPWRRTTKVHVFKTIQPSTYMVLQGATRYLQPQGRVGNPTLLYPTAPAKASLEARA